MVNISTKEFIAELHSDIKRQVMISNLDLQAVTNLLEVKLTNQLLLKAIKKGLLAIQNMDAKKIYRQAQKE